MVTRFTDLWMVIWNGIQKVIDFLSMEISFGFLDKIPDWILALFSPFLLILPTEPISILEFMFGAGLTAFLTITIVKWFVDIVF